MRDFVKYIHNKTLCFEIAQTFNTYYSLEKIDFKIIDKIFLHVFLTLVIRKSNVDIVSRNNTYTRECTDTQRIFKIDFLGN